MREESGVCSINGYIECQASSGSGVARRVPRQALPAIVTRRSRPPQHGSSQGAGLARRQERLNPAASLAGAGLCAEGSAKAWRSEVMVRGVFVVTKDAHHAPRQA
jgi:hypothetical protein